VFWGDFRGDQCFRSAIIGNLSLAVKDTDGASAWLGRMSWQLWSACPFWRSASQGSRGCVLNGQGDRAGEESGKAFSLHAGGLILNVHDGGEVKEPVDQRPPSVTTVAVGVPG